LSSSRLPILVAAGILSCAALSGCGAGAHVVRRSAEPREPLATGVRVAFAPVDFASEAEGDEGLAAFVRGTSVGHLTQTGGFVFDDALQATRSATVTVSRRDAYREHAMGVVLDALERAAGAARWRVVDAAPTVSLTRSLWEVAPGPIEPGDPKANYPVNPVRLRFRRPGAPPTEARLLVVPVVVHAYSHNAQWFVGRRQGAPGGARVRVVVGVYDTSRARWVRDVDLDVSVVDEANFRPDRFEARALFEAAWKRWRDAFRGAFLE
jgi:hypothetical protein